MRGGFVFYSALPFFEIARVLVPFDHIVCRIVNSDAAPLTIIEIRPFRNG